MRILERWTRSLGGRLIVVSTVSALTTLFLATGFLYWGLARSLQQEDEEFLADKVRVMWGILQERPDDHAALREEVTQEPRYVGSAMADARNYYVRVLDPDGDILVETPGMDRVAAPSDFPVAGAAGVPAISTDHRIPDGRSYLLMAAGAPLGRGAVPGRLLQIALDRSREERILVNYRRQLAAVLTGGVLLSAGAAVLVARTGLRPVLTMANAVEGIGATRLHERIGGAPWPEELVALAQAFDTMLGRLEESFTRLSRFSAELAHELRTPINVLRGEAEVALSRTRRPEEYRAVLESSLEEHGRLSRVIEQLLFLARAESAGMPPERSMLQAREEIEQVVEFQRPLAEEQKVTIVCHGESTLWADALLFRRALTNCLDNALKYTPPGGTIAVAVEGCPDGSVAIRVSDTGCGIEPEHLPRVFDRFYRACREESGGGPGTGLGLAIVKSIMDLHGGGVTVWSDPGRGTILTLCFPSPPGASGEMRNL